MTRHRPLRWGGPLLLLATGACSPESGDVLSRPEASPDAGLPDGAAPPDAGPDATPPLALVAFGPTDTLRGQAFGVRVVALDAEPPVSWRLASGRLPDGVALASEPEPDQAFFTGPPREVGPFAVELEATDARGDRARARVDLQVFETLVVVGSGLAPATVGQTYGATVAATGGELPLTWSVPDGALPDGLELRSDPGGVARLAGVPEAEGRFAFELRATDARGTAASARLAIEVSSPLEIATAELADGILGRSYRAPVRVVGGTPPYHWRLDPETRLPPGLALFADEGPEAILEGTAGDWGIFRLQLRVGDGAGREATKALFLDVSDSGVRLGIEGPTRYSEAACEPFEAQFRAVGGGQVGLTWSAPDLPDGLSLEVLEGSTLRMSGYLDEARIHGPFTLTARDARGEEAEVDLEIEVAPPIGPRWAALAQFDPSRQLFVQALDLCASVPTTVAARLAVDRVDPEDVAGSPSFSRFAVPVSTTATDALAVFDVADSTPTHALFPFGDGVRFEAPRFATDDRLLFRAEVERDLGFGVPIPFAQIVSLDLDVSFRQPRLVAPMTSNQAISSVSPDGRWLVFVDDDDDLWLADLDAPSGSPPRALGCASGAGVGFTWSAWAPGGQLVYRCANLVTMVLDFARGAPGTEIRLPGSADEVVRPPEPGGRWLTVSSGPREIVFIDLDPDHFADRTTVDLGPGSGSFGLVWAPDERHVVLRGDSELFLLGLPPPRTALGAPAPIPVGPPGPELVFAAFGPAGDRLFWSKAATPQILQVRRLRPPGPDRSLGPGNAGILVAVPGTDLFVARGSNGVRLFDLSATPTPVVFREVGVGTREGWARPDGSGVFLIEDGTGELGYLDLFSESEPRVRTRLLGGGSGLRALRLPQR